MENRVQMRSLLIDERLNDRLPTANQKRWMTKPHPCKIWVRGCLIKLVHCFGFYPMRVTISSSLDSHELTRHASSLISVLHPLFPLGGYSNSLIVLLRTWLFFLLCKEDQWASLGMNTFCKQKLWVTLIIIQWWRLALNIDKCSNVVC